ncbi:hypothetical protein PITCH_A1580019 [uncultured Desulfobacterium sp.]|uniref:Uncharacterized protein n=1 Tax=uncultured Desulfobacterium sp. TaxID=201089 RepID=A0A445MTK5_9BACT|nr:hypothetical protein PITCH_A1580019 [uncultured Desulfobacterium sp.]
MAPWTFNLKNAVSCQHLAFSLRNSKYCTNLYLHPLGETIEVVNMSKFLD